MMLLRRKRAAELAPPPIAPVNDPSAAEAAARAAELRELAASLEALQHEAQAPIEAVQQHATTVNDAIGTAANDIDGFRARIGEIAGHAATAADKAKGAVSQVEVAGQAVQHLRATSTEVSRGAAAIAQIATRTRFLALNAAIEAARSGAMGRGFAVVANEVKQLAVETTDATQRVLAEVARIREQTEATVAALERISHIIADIAANQDDIARAVDEQTRSSSGFNTAIADALMGLAEITTAVDAVAGVTARAGEGGAHINRIAAALDGAAEEATGPR